MAEHEHVSAWSKDNVGSAQEQPDIQGKLLHRRLGAVDVVGGRPTPNRSGPPAAHEPNRQATHHSEPRVRVCWSSSDEASYGTARSRIEQSGDVPQDAQISVPEVLSVDHALADPVADVEARELVPVPPVVMPDDEVRLVAYAPARAQPAVGKIVVLSGRADIPVETAECEHD